MTAYDAQCSNCNAPFQTPFQPKPGREILCAECLIMQQDLSTHPFFIGLEAFAREKFGEKVQAFKVVRSKGDYNILIQLKDAKAPLIGEVEFRSETGHDITLTMPVPLFVYITTGDSELKLLLAEFKRRYKELIITVT